MGKKTFKYAGTIYFNSLPNFPTEGGALSDNPLPCSSQESVPLVDMFALPFRNGPYLQS